MALNIKNEINLTLLMHILTFCLIIRDLLGIYQEYKKMA